MNKEVDDIWAGPTDAAETAKSPKWMDRLSKLVEESPAIIWAFDEVNGKMLYLNGAAEDILAHDRRKFYDHPTFWWELIHEDDRPRVAALNATMRESKVAVAYRARFRHAAGHYVELAVAVKPICNARGDIVRTEGVAIHVPAESEGTNK